MTQRVVYKTLDGNVEVIVPSPNALKLHTIDEIAQKDVPSGLSYKIVQESDIPTERTFRDAWDIADSELTDGTGASSPMFVSDPRHPDYVEPSNDNS